MPSISIENKQYKTYILTDESSNSQLEVVPERGGIATKWRVQGQEIFYLDEERYTHPELSVRGGNPILFPICGNLPDNVYTVNGKQYTLKQHGFARELPWEVSQSASEVQVILKANEQTQAVYPFDFQLTFTYLLAGNSLILNQQYTNKSSQPMPFSAGFHPYFAVSDKNQLSFEIPSKEYQDQKTKQTHSFDGSFDFELDEIDVSFKQLSANSASVTDNSRKSKLTIEYDDIFSTLVFWTVKGKDFYCLEPWTAPRNSLNTGEKLTILEPGTSCSAMMKLTAEFF